MSVRSVGGAGKLCWTAGMLAVLPDLTANARHSADAITVKYNGRQQLLELKNVSLKMFDTGVTNVNLRDLMLVVKRRLAVDFARAREQPNGCLTHHD